MTIVLTFGEVDLLDAPDLPVAFDELDVPDGREHKLRAEVVRVEEQGLEHPGRGHLRPERVVVSSDAHVSRKFDRQRKSFNGSTELR